MVETVGDPTTEITLEEAHRFDPEAELGDEIGVKVDTSGFGRILAQTAKQVIIQMIREAERDNVFEEYKDRKGEIVNGIVRRFEKGAIIVDLGRAEAVLPLREQVPRETYRPNDRIRAYVIDVNKASKGAQIILSRTCMEMLTKLFEQEVPEMYEGIVTIQAAAREPGGRSKIAVVSRDSDVDPVGACVGMKGSRVQAVVQELRGERIDIVPWSPDPARYVCASLSPAQVSKVIIDEGAKSMDVIVPDDQLSLAIGRKGQNVRLAVQLTGWRIDIKSESKMRELAQWLSEAVSVVEGCGDADAELLLQQGITSLEDLAECQLELLTLAAGHRRGRRARDPAARARAGRAQEDRGRGGPGRGGAGRGGGGCRSRGGGGGCRGGSGRTGRAGGARPSGAGGESRPEVSPAARAASPVLARAGRESGWRRSGHTSWPKSSASTARSSSNEPRPPAFRSRARWRRSTTPRSRSCARSSAARARRRAPSPSAA